MIGLSQTRNDSATQERVVKEVFSNSSTILGYFFKKFCSNHSLKAKFGIESEFYLKLDSFNDDFVEEEFLERINAMGRKFSLFDCIDRERGDLQFEIKSLPTDDLLSLIAQFQEIRKEVVLFCAIFGEADFSARPFSSDCANAFQLSFSLFDGGDNKMFHDKELIEYSCSYFTTNIEDLFFFANSCDDDYRRYEIDFNRRIHKLGKFVAPCAKSWGYDNRSCAIRVVRNHNENSRIEVRIASNNCQIELFCCAILIHLDLLLTKDFVLKKDNIDPIYGNSFDEKYQLESFFKSHDQAMNYFLSSESSMLKYFSKILSEIS